MTDFAPALMGPVAERLRGAFAAEEADSQRRLVRARLIAAVLIALRIPVTLPDWTALYYEGLVLVFALLSFVPLWLRRADLYMPWQRYLFVALDLALMTVAVIPLNPMCEPCAGMPAAITLDFPNDLYYFLLIGLSVFSYAPRLVMWSGIAAALAWTVGVLWILDQPGVYATFGNPVTWETWSLDERVAFAIDPARVHVPDVIQQDILFIIVAGILAAAVHRTRRLVYRQAEAERERTNLARHFSPNMVEELARTDKPLDGERRQDIAVLFVDIVGFTQVSAGRPPEEVIGLLRGFHGHMAEAVFAHEGTLDKFLGDGLMATFGTPHARADDASRALACARDMVGAIADWNGERAAAGETPVVIGIGAHFGPVVMGDIGDEHRLEFAVIGDTVNIASRLENLTRDLGVALIASDDLIARVRAEGGADALHDGMNAQEQTLRGRDGVMRIWALAREAPV